MENNKRPTLGNGKVCYIEIAAVEINTSASFYKEVFGWRIRQRGDGHLAFDDTVGEVSGTWVVGQSSDRARFVDLHHGGQRRYDRRDGYRTWRQDRATDRYGRAG